MKPLTHAMRRLKMTVGYDGTAYAGWQVQPLQSTVQHALERAIAVIVGHSVKVHGSGRTDQGVHARRQVLHVDVATRLDAPAMMRACNARLPADIRVFTVTEARADFHARRSATGKEYRYFIYNAAILPPERRLYAVQMVQPLDVAHMNEAAQAFVGAHDFAPFSANPQREIASTVREIYACTVTKRGREIVFKVSGNGFLYKQVRSMVGFLLRVGEGAEAPGAVAEVLAAQAPRTARVPTAPPQGLFMWQVWYD